MFDEPQLNDMIVRAAAGNLGVKDAVARMRDVRAGVVSLGLPDAMEDCADLLQPEMMAKLQTAESRWAGALNIDCAWSERRAAIQARFDAWLQDEDHVYDFTPEGSG